MDERLKEMVEKTAGMSKERLWDEWQKANPRNLLGYDIEAGWEAAWEESTIVFLVVLENLIKNGILSENPR